MHAKNDNFFLISQLYVIKIIFNVDSLPKYFKGNYWTKKRIESNRRISNEITVQLSR